MLVENNRALVSGDRQLPFETESGVHSAWVAYDDDDQAVGIAHTREMALVDADKRNSPRGYEDYKAPREARAKG